MANLSHKNKWCHVFTLVVRGLWFVVTNRALHHPPYWWPYSGHIWQPSLYCQGFQQIWAVYGCKYGYHCLLDLNYWFSWNDFYKSRSSTGHRLVIWLKIHQVHVSDKCQHVPSIGAFTIVCVTNTSKTNRIVACSIISSIYGPCTYNQVPSFELVNTT